MLEALPPKSLPLIRIRSMVSTILRRQPTASDVNLTQHFNSWPSANHRFIDNASPSGIFSFLKEGKVGLVKSLAGDYDAAAVRSKIDNLVEENPVLMFSFTTWPYCIKAKAILDEKGAKYMVLELDEISDGKAIRAEMGDMLGRTRSVYSLNYKLFAAWILSNLILSILQCASNMDQRDVHRRMQRWTNGRNQYLE